MTPEEIKLNHEIEYNKRMAKSTVKIGISVFCIVLIVMFGFIFKHYQVKDELAEIKQTEDTIYTYWKGDNDYIRFAKPVGVDYNAFPNHSEIKRPIQP